MNAVPRSQRNPVEAFPQDLIFFFRVILFLRGLCSLLSVRVRYVDAFTPYARLAMVRSVPVKDHTKTVVYKGVKPNR